MSSRKTIYLTDASEKILGECDSLSGRINTIISRYGCITCEGCPSLTLAEWSAVCDVLNGTWLNAEVGSFDICRSIWAEISDGDRLDGLGAKWGIDAQDLSRRVQVMPYHEQVAIVEIATLFWQSPKLNDLEIEDLLRECGAKITE